MTFILAGDAFRPPHTHWVRYTLPQVTTGVAPILGAPRKSRPARAGYRLSRGSRRYRMAAVTVPP